MNETHYAKGITAEADEAQQLFIETKDKLLNENTEPFAWCYCYELPFREHMTQVIAAIIQGYDGLINAEQVASYRQLAGRSE